MNVFTHLIINKNRGWRGLAEARAIDFDTKEEMKIIFSFSQAVWTDLVLHHKIVMQDINYYYVIYFIDEEEKLPKPTQQRSVLIKNFNGKIKYVYKIDKNDWKSCAVENWTAIAHFIKNRNNHTTSNWNCIGIRVTPEI